MNTLELGAPNFFCKGPTVHVLSFAGHRSLFQRLNSVAVARKQPWTIGYEEWTWLGSSKAGGGLDMALGQFADHCSRVSAQEKLGLSTLNKEGVSVRRLVAFRQRQL